MATKTEYVPVTSTSIETCLWSIQRENGQRNGFSAAEREMYPLAWYINTGRASVDFLRKLIAARPVLIARDLHKGGSVDEVIDRVCRRIGYERGCY